MNYQVPLDIASDQISDYVTESLPEPIHACSVIFSFGKIGHCMSFDERMQSIDDTLSMSSHENFNALSMTPPVTRKPISPKPRVIPALNRTPYRFSSLLTARSGHVQRLQTNVSSRELYMNAAYRLNTPTCKRNKLIQYIPTRAESLYNHYMTPNYSLLSQLITVLTQSHLHAISF